MVVRTPYKKNPRISEVAVITKSQCIQIDTKVETLINNGDNLTDIKENQGIFFDDDIPTTLFQPHITERVFDPVQAHFMRQAAQSPDVNTDLNVRKAEISQANANEVKSE